MKSKLKSLYVLTSILLCLCLLCSCGNKSYKETEINPNFGGTINIFAYATDSLNPLLTRHQTNAQALSLMYHSLLIQEADLTHTPYLAEYYRFNQDGEVLNITLKKGITFTDGTPVLAYHVKNSLDVLKTNPDSMFYRIFKYVSSYKVVSDYEIMLELSQKGFGVLSHLTFPVVKERDNPIGSGPYIMTNRTDAKIVLNARSQDKTNIQTINIMTYPSTESMANAFMTNEITVLSSDFYKLAQTSTKSRVNKYEYISDYFTFLGFNTENEYLKNVYTRYGIASCIDKNEMINNLLIGYATPTNSPFKPNTIYHNLNKNDLLSSTDKALKYFEESDFKPEDMEFTLLVNKESSAKVRTAEYIASRLMIEKIKVNVVSVDYDRYIEKLDNGEYDLFIGEYEMAQDYDLSFMLSSSSNYFNFYDDEITANINSFNNSTTKQMRQCYANELQTILKNKLPFVSLYYRNNVLISDENVVGDIKPTQSNIYNHIEKWIVK